MQVNPLYQKKKNVYKMQTILQKSLIAITVMIGVILIVNFIGKAKRSDIILQMMANMSRNLDKLDAGLDAINSETEIAKNRFKKLIILHREKLIDCVYHKNEEKDKNIIFKNPTTTDTNI